MKKILLVLLLIIIGLVSRTLYYSGFFRSIPASLNENIVKIEGPIGVEDLTIDHASKKAYLSSHNRRKFFAEEGAIYLAGLETDSIQPKKMKIVGLNHEFRPHGISFLKADKSLLFVINHTNEQNFIERFRVEGDSLILEKSFSNEGFISPNDLVAVSAESFYFTNDHDDKPSLKRTLQDFLMIGTGHIMFFDGSRSRRVSDNVPYANGINISQDKKQVFMASTTGRTLHIYERQKNGNLSQLQQHNFETGLDNIELDESGNLWIGSHLKMLDFLKHSKDEKNKSSGEVFWVDKTSILTSEATKNVVYVTDGEQISGLSVGAPYLNGKGEKRLLIGGVFDPKILVLKIN